jgi:hypothetical protein
MNELMQKITEQLNISIDKAPEVYSGLRAQYIFWEVASTISAICGIIIFLITIDIFIFGDFKIKKKSKILICIGIISIIILVASQVLVYIFAPDIAFLKGVFTNAN